MLYYLCTESDAFHYILRNKEYVVGRKECDILIANDQSISRKHAFLSIQKNNVVLTDHNSKYGIFVNQIKMEMNTSTVLKPNDVIRFGVLQSIYTFKAVRIITTTSSVKSTQKQTFQNNIIYLGGNIINNWCSECTHVTVEEATLTVKVLSALIKGIPIVTLKYWEDYVKCVKENLPPPDTANYKPKCSEVILGKNVSFNFKEERQQLFKNKTFVFPTKKDANKMTELIGLAGGNTISWDTRPLTTKEIDNSSVEYILMQIDTDTEKLPISLMHMMQYYSSKGKRIIPLQEIALALIRCSCEKDCNPNFNKNEAVLGPPNEIQDTFKSEQILAVETQTQISQDSVQTVFIPNTLDVDTEINIDTKNDLQIEDQLLDVKPPKITSNSKRGPDMVEAENPPKKFKSNILGTSTSNLVNNPFVFPSKKRTEPIPKSTFAFKKDLESCENEEPVLKETTFSNKRKSSQNGLNEQPAKKASTSMVKNPFLDIVQSKACLEIRPTEPVKPVASSTRIYLDDITSINYSEIQRDHQWISKGSDVCDSKNDIKILTEQEVDEELKVYIKSFENSVVIREMSFSPKSKDSTVSNQSTLLNTNKKNYKKFKKVQPLYIQNRIIPQNSYERIICHM